MPRALITGITGRDGSDRAWCARAKVAECFMPVAEGHILQADPSLARQGPGWAPTWTSGGWAR